MRSLTSMGPALLDLRIDKLVHGGLGIARTPSGVVFVTGVLPGELVHARVTGSRAGAVFAEPVDIPAPSPERRTPPCPYAGVCGGCDWQHLTYDAQIRAKREIALDCLHRIGRLRDLPGPEVLASPEWGYRMRTQLKIDHSRTAVGFFRRSSNEVIDLDRCPLLCGELNGLLARRAEALGKLPATIAQLKAIAGETIASDPVVEGLTCARTIVRAGERRFPVSGDSFFQGNRFLLEPLGTWAAPSVGGQLLWDLYGGVGFFSVMLGASFARGILVESVGAQAEAARRTFAENGMTHLTAETAAAEEFLARPSERPDCCIVDPPRPGLTRLVREAIGRIRPRTILYVSCDPSTQARDAGFLVNRCGYAVKRMAIFDLNPQTHHIETALVMTLGA